MKSAGARSRCAGAADQRTSHSATARIPGSDSRRRRPGGTASNWTIRPGRRSDSRIAARRVRGAVPPPETIVTKPPSLLAVVLAGFTAFLSLYATQPLLPLFQSVFGASHFAVSLTVTATTTAVALAAPFVGRLADAWGKPRVIVIAAFTLAAATILASTAATLNQVIGWRFVQGLVTPGVFAVTVAYIHDRWDPARAGRAT